MLGWLVGWPGVCVSVYCAHMAGCVYFLLACSRACTCVFELIPRTLQYVNHYRRGVYSKRRVDEQ